MLDWLKKRDNSPKQAVPPGIARQQTGPAVAASPGADRLAARTAPVPGRHIGLAYDPGLIAEFLDTHQTLLSLHGHARMAALGEDWQAVANALSTFRTELTDHLVSEGIRLYVYLKQSLKEEPEIQAQMRHFATEMHGIGAAVMKYLDELRDISVNPSHRREFISQWDQIGGTLVQRIQREERVLYPMYQPFMPS